MVSSWEPAHSLLEDAISEAEIAAAPCLPALAVASLTLPPGREETVSRLLARLWYSLNPLFYEPGRA